MTIHCEAQSWLDEFVEKAKDPKVKDEDLAHSLVCLGVDIPSAAVLEHRNVPSLVSHFLNLPYINRVVHSCLKDTGRLEAMGEIFSLDLRRWSNRRKFIGSTAYGKRLVKFFSNNPEEFFRG